MTGGDPTNGGRVTLRELYNALNQQNKERADMERRILSKMDNVCEAVNRQDERIKRNTEEVEKLRSRSNVNDIAVGIGAAIAAAVSAAFGVKH